MLPEKRGPDKTDSPIDWPRIERVLVIKLRSIGDTVLATPSLFALRRFLPGAQIDILLEDWVAPLLQGSDLVDNVLPIADTTSSRLSTARELRKGRYDVVFNLHGGTTATLLTRATGARHRIGFSHYQYSFLHNHLLSSAAHFWGRTPIHSAEQQLALLGFAGVPVDDLPGSRLIVTDQGRTDRVKRWFERGDYALLHPGTAFFTKQWSPENFARTAEFFADRGLAAIGVGSNEETSMLDEVKRASQVPIATFDDLSLPEITALASEATIFVGNDSGIAHIAAAVGTPSVVIFGSSNRDHWYPWTDAPNEIVYEEFHCQPCDAYECKEYGDAPCIRNVAVEKVFAAIQRILAGER